MAMGALSGHPGIPDILLSVEASVVKKRRPRSVFYHTGFHTCENDPILERERLLHRQFMKFPDLGGSMPVSWKWLRWAGEDERDLEGYSKRGFRGSSQHRW